MTEQQKKIALDTALIAMNKAASAIETLEDFETFTNLLSEFQSNLSDILALGE